MPSLYIYPVDAPGAAVRLWPLEGGTVPPGTIQEGQHYILELREVENERLVNLYLDDELLQALRAPDDHTARWQWSPGFYAGSISLRISLAPGRDTVFEIVTDPDLRKLTRARFDQMVRDILDDTFALFSLSGFRAGIARGLGGAPPPIARLEFLRSRIEELERTVLRIARRPVRLLKSEEKLIPTHLLRGATAQEILRSFRTGRIRKELRDPGRLPSAFKGYFPQDVRKAVRQTGLDLKEHQDIKSSLKSWAAWLSVVGDRLVAEGKDSKSAFRWGTRCRRMVHRLHYLSGLPFFSAVSNRTAPVTLTSIYRRVPAYRAFFALYRDINLGIANIVGDFLQLPLARTFDLYELWCFLRLTRAVALVTGSTHIDASNLFNYEPKNASLTIASGSIVVPIGQGYSLCFQRQYQEYWLASDGRGSFSRHMRPDVSLDISTPGGASGLIVLDAKYRIWEGLNESLSSIHMYRDALVEGGTGELPRVVIGAYLLSPLALDQPLEKEWQNTPMPGRLFHPEYRGTFRFGAVTLRPGMSVDEVAAALQAVLIDAGVDLPSA